MATSKPRTQGKESPRQDQDRSAPTESVSINLDELERENPTEPFVFIHKGKRYLASDPQDIDWQALLRALSDPVLFFRLVLPADDVQQFLDTTMPGWKMNMLMERYRQHYGLPGPGEANALPH